MNKQQLKECWAWLHINVTLFSLYFQLTQEIFFDRCLNVFML